MCILMKKISVSRYYLKPCCVSDGSKARYGLEYDMPVGIELKIGNNWLDLSEVSYVTSNYVNLNLKEI